MTPPCLHSPPESCCFAGDSLQGAGFQGEASVSALAGEAGKAKGTNHTPEQGGFLANTVCGCSTLSHLPLLQGKAVINATQSGGPKAYGGARTVINVSRDEKQRWSVEGTVVQGQEQWGVCI